MDNLLEVYEEPQDTEGSSLTDFLYPAPAPRTVGGIVRWWEARRLHYNLIVGGTGLISLAAVHLLAALPPYAFDIGPVLIPVIIYGLAANVCYLLGPTAEIGIEKLSRGKILPTGPGLFRMGLTFSLGLTLLPVLLMGVSWIARVISWIF